MEREGIQVVGEFLAALAEAVASGKMFDRAWTEGKAITPESLFSG